MKNPKTGIAKAMTQLRTPRRLVLSGTPMQNNLVLVCHTSAFE
jgi:SNF2 family DNA or RNA helicase